MSTVYITSPSPMFASLPVTNLLKSELFLLIIFLGCNTIYQYYLILPINYKYIPTYLS